MRGEADVVVCGRRVTMRQTPTLPSGVDQTQAEQNEGRPRLFDELRRVLRVKHYVRRTEKTYVEWVRRFVRFHRPQPPAGTREGGRRALPVRELTAPFSERLPWPGFTANGIPSEDRNFGRL